MNTTKVFSFCIALFLMVLGPINAFSQKMDAKSTMLIDKMVQVTGEYEKLWKKGDVQFDYVYDNFEKGKDVSKEKLIFDGEQSWASYSHHDLNVLPGKKGVAVQALVNGKPMLTLDGKTIKNPEAIGGTVFLREVNSYWFTMIYKLKDAGTNYKYMGTENVDGINYEKVSLTYDGAITNKEANDEYVLYFNPKTSMLDLFYFSLPARGINKPVIKMTMEYEKIDGVYIPTVRKSYAPNKEGNYSLNGEYTFSNIKFGNGFKAEDFMLKGM